MAVHAGRKRRFRALIDRLEARDGTVGVIGLGYVGLPVAAAFAEAGFQVVGVDGDQKRVDGIMNGKSYIQDVTDQQIAGLTATGRFKATTSYQALSEAIAVLICVPTPLTDGIPDLGPIKSAGKALGEVLSPDTVVILESTTYPGTTEELLKPLLEHQDFQAGREFYLAFSPERIDPGNPHYGFRDIPKIVGGVTPDCSIAAETLYRQVVPKTMQVSGTREAELAKLVENTFRHVNIALVNELAIYAHELEIDVWQAIEAAGTKPFGFMPFWPSPGWGGHCIPLDPSYLSWRIRRDRSHEFRFVELAQMVNSEMPRHVMERISVMLNEKSRSIRGSKILGIGVAYKGGTEDTRGAPAIKILSQLAGRGAKVSYHDPLVPEAQIGGKTLKSANLTRKMLREVDLVVIFVPQVNVEWPRIVEEAPLIFDCCNALGHRNGKVTRL